MNKIWAWLDRTTERRSRSLAQRTSRRSLLVGFGINDDAIGVLHKVYDFLDIELTPEIENSVRSWDEGKSKKLFARNTYAPEEFGLTVEQIHGAFGEYMERFAEYI